MDFPLSFICAARRYCTPDAPVPAPYLRRAFEVSGPVASAELLICGLGFYELHVNGRDVTKGPLAPYISAPDDLIYYDRYDLAPLLTPGTNVLGLLLGNGMQNAFGGAVWDFTRARWRGAPKAALRLTIVYADGHTGTVESDTDFRTAPSPIRSDDLRLGVVYDARCAQPRWDTADFDDSGWSAALPAPTPRGEAVLCAAEPIAVARELRPVSVAGQGDGYLYDFGENTAGVCRLTVAGERGQIITLQHGELLEDGVLTFENLLLGGVPGDAIQKDTYICAGGGPETFVPAFTYHGFRYVLVRGITAEQATADLLTCLVMHSDLREAGGFSCSDETANQLQAMTRRSTLANFYYFPTDCPHREKNGWMGDAAVSAEHTLLNLAAEKSYREWLRNIRKAQDERGALPGIVPTGGWGFAWGNGPAWDAALTEIPYQIWRLRGDPTVARENAASILRYLHYLTTRMDQNGLLAIGLGDWCEPGRKSSDCKAPLVFTDSVVAMDICRKAARLFAALGMTAQRTFADTLRARLREAVRAHLLDFGTMTAAGRCQTAQAMAIYYDVFEKAEQPRAFERLLELIRLSDGHMDTGILGARVLFRVLSAFGESDLAFDMITRPDYPSYGNWVARGATSLWENFQPEGTRVLSQNHHFFGDVSAWFIEELAGIQLNLRGADCREVRIAPQFVRKLSHAEGFHIAPDGKIEVRWERTDGGIRLTVSLPAGMTGVMETPRGYLFDDGTAWKPAASGEYRILGKP